MAKEERDKERKMFIGVVWNCATELKLILTALIFLGSLATVLQFLPSRLSVSTSDLRSCLSKLSSETPPPSSSSSLPNNGTTTPASFLLNNLSTTPASSLPNNLSTTPASFTPASSLPNNLSTIPASSLPNNLSTTPASSPPPPSPPPPPPPSPSVQEDQILDGGIIKRAFNPYGAAAYTFIQMGTYRGGLNTFAIIGLASKPLHLYGKPRFQCQWIPENDTAHSVTTSAYKMLPDWGYGRVYTVVVVNCTFSEPVGVDGSGGRLILHASTSGGGDRKVNATEKIEALREAPGSFDASIFTSPPRYDYLYCGSSLYGNLSPQRVREWLAYHVRLLGVRSHFVIHDAGGVHREVLDVLKPWMEKGYVTLQDIREQERFDGYYHNQFMVVNDCLHRYRFAAKWMFFFDVDEYVYVPPKSTIKSVLDSFSDYTQFTIEQMPMSNKLCLAADAGKTFRKWGIEKLVYKDAKRGIRRDRKYAVQPRNVFATGVHMSQNVAGKTTHKTERRIMYFHYHGTIAERREPCRHLFNETQIIFEGTSYVLDDTLRGVAASVKRFELKAIGSVLQRTRQ